MFALKDLPVPWDGARAPWGLWFHRASGLGEDFRRRGCCQETSRGRMAGEAEAPTADLEGACDLKEQTCAGAGGRRAAKTRSGRALVSLPGAVAGLSSGG